MIGIFHILRIELPVGVGELPGIAQDLHGAG